ncbi:MAG: TonB-dependent receptor [Alistipes sp.]|nr:TonB-dependent receptor [Alistipes sp.]
MTANLNYTHKIQHNLSANLITTASYRTQNAPGTLEQTADYQNGTISRTQDINPYKYAMNTSRILDPNEYYRFDGEDFNIRHELINNYMQYKVTDFKFQGQLKWKPIESVELSVLGVWRLQDAKTCHYISEASNVFYLLEDEYVTGYKGVYNRDNIEVTSRDFRTTIRWNRIYSLRHTFDILGGAEVRAVDRKHHANITDSTDDVVEPLMSQVGSRPETYYRNVAYFASGTYSYCNKYVFNVTARYEGTNRFGGAENSRWLPTWNISGRWNLHEERLFQSASPIISNLSLRTSYSVTADRGPEAARLSATYLTDYPSLRPYPEHQEDGIWLSDIEARDVSYEKKREFNIGLNIGLLNDRISITTDYYRRRNYDLIGLTTGQGVGGQFVRWGNVADMRSHGYELSVSSANIVKPSFTWITDFIFWTGRTKITRFQNDGNVFQLVSGSGYPKKGYPVRGLFSIRFLGLDDVGIPILQGPDEPERYISFDTKETDHCNSHDLI